MFKINKITSSPVVDFAAEELKKYLRMMMPRCGEIEIAYAPDATDGFRLGIMADFSLDTSEAEDLYLDDIVHIDTDEKGGIIAGSNARSVLLAVYKYLTLNGCRWLFPGIDGEFIPIKDVEATKYHKMADMRYRGQCNEGAEYQQNMMETIDFTPKIGMNIFMIEFDNPYVYYKYYYNRRGNNAREPEPITPDTALQWKRQCEAELSKRGLQLHDMGHGWTAESFGIDSSDGWTKNENNYVPEESKDFLAMINGERKLWNGIALNTNFCMSNKKARALVVKRVCDYAQLYTNVDYLHVWLADSKNNHCECEECKKKIPSDFYVMLMNEIDEELIKRELDTRIVFCCYYDTIYPAETVKINNPDRFSLLLGAITRKYTETIDPSLNGYELKKYDRNKNVFPTDINEFVEYAKEWKRRCGISVIVYEYHFWIHQYYDLGLFSFAKVLYNDIKGYSGVDFKGTIQDGSQRSFFPNGFDFYVYAQTLFDTSVDFEELKRDYFSHAYGEDWHQVVEFFEKLEKAAPHMYVAGQLSADERVGKFYNPALAEGFRSVGAICDEFNAFIEAHKNMPMRAQTVAVRLLKKYCEYCKGVADALALKCFGLDEEAKKVYHKFADSFGQYEIEIERYYDQHMAFKALEGRVFNVGSQTTPGI